ncbi:MAG: RMD1 family protein [Planctomycetota bacterium]
MENLFGGKGVIGVRALLLGERLDLKALEMTQRLAIGPLVVSAGEQGCAVLFRYGGVVFFEMSSLEQASFVESLRPFLKEPFEPYEVEDASARLITGRDEGTETGVILLTAYDLPRIQVVADILGKSVVLAHYERIVASAFDKIEPFAVQLKTGKRAWHSGRVLLQHIGDTLLIQHKMVGRAEVDDKPDILWDHPELERLYHRLHDEYELRDRHDALEQKLELIGHTVETLLDILQANRTLRVEWYVVALILVEILLTLYELFLHG